MQSVFDLAKRLGYDDQAGVTPLLDVEKGKQGYNQYLADVEAEKTAKAQAEKEKKWWEKLLEFNAKNYTALPSDSNAGAIAFANAANFYAQEDSYKRPSDDWTDDERWAFGEKYATNKDEAYAFAEQVNNSHAQKSREDQAKKITDWTNKNVGTKILGSAASLGINTLAGGLGFVDSLAQQVGRGKIVQHDFLMPHEVSGKIQETVATGLNDKYGTVDFLGGERGWGDVYGLGMSIGQSLLAAGTTKMTGSAIPGLVSFFGMAASQGVTDALERGASSEQALALGTIAGLAESIPEMISVDKLLSLKSAASVKNFFLQMLKQAGEEAGEELTTSVINEVADRFVMDGKSNYNMLVQQYLASGMTLKEAQNKAISDTIKGFAYDALSGFVSGGVSGGLAVGSKTLANRLDVKANAQALEQLQPQQNELIEEGKKYKPTEKRAAHLEKKIAEGKEASGYELRMLESEISNASHDADVDTLRKAIVKKMKAEGLNEAQAKRLGEIALNKAIGNEISAIQETMLKRNDAAMKVYKQMDTDNMLSGYADSEWTKDTPLAKLKADSGELQKGIERQLANAKVEYDQSKIVDKSGKAIFEKSGADSKIHLDGISSELTKNNVAELKAIEKIANELGVNIHVYETMLDENGDRVYIDKDGNKITDNGYYDPKDKSIHIDLKAGQGGEGTMLYTASHELVHYMKDISKEHYDALEQLVTDELIKGGKSIEALMEAQRQKALENGQNLTDDEIREEMIADACQSFLASKSAIADIKALKTKNKSLWTALKKFFTTLFTKLNKIYKTVDPDSAEGKYIADMRNSVKNIRDAFMEGVTAAGETYAKERKALGKNSEIKVNAKGEFVQGVTSDKKIMSNARTYFNKGRSTLMATLESEGFSKGDIDAAMKIMDGHMELVKKFGEQYTAQDIANEAIVSTDLKTGESVLSALISNGDYPVNIDLLTICKKRKAYQGVINRLCESGLINTATLDSLAIAEINKILGKYGFETACLGCYVESRRIRIQEWAQTICKEWNSIVDKNVGKGKGEYFNTASDTFVKDLSDEQITKLSAELEEAYERDGLKYGKTSVVKKMEQLQREVPSLRKYLSVADLITPEGRTNLRRLSSELNSLVACRYGSNTPKIIQEFNPYNSELAMYGQVPKAYKSLRDYLYAIGGARMQSFSDFIIENWFDYAQIVADLSARKLPMHTCTKELALVKLFGMTGIKINMSLIPDVDTSLSKDYAGLTVGKDGKYELIFADKDRYKATNGKSYMQSFNFADAIAMQNDPNYSANVGTIAIGISNMQIRMMLNDSRIRMVIPYHSSGMNPIFAHLVGIKNYNDYTNDQTTGVKELKDANGKTLNVSLTKDQKAKLTAGFEFNEALQRLGDARAAAEEYKTWCADSSKHKIEINGKTYYATLKPKFAQFSNEKNYYKLLADYNPYDCITEESKPQGDVQQIYPDNFADILEDELKKSDLYNKKQDAKWDDAMSEIEDYLKNHTKADTVAYADEHGIKLSAKDRKGVKTVKHSGRNRITPEMDASYLDAVKRGDMETAQRMVDEAAKNAMPNSILREGYAITKGEEDNGTLIKMYHGSGAKDFYTFKENDGALGKGIYVSSNWDEAVGYAIDKLGIVQNDDGYSYIWNGEVYDGIGSIGDALESAGYVRPFYANVTNESDISTSSVYWEDVIALVRSGNQLKSADPITYDDNGNVIPLSERFDSTQSDIRRSSRAKAPFVSPTASSIVTNIQSAYTPTKMDKLKTSAIATQIAFTNAQAGIESIAKKYGVKNIESLVQAARVATNQAEEMIGGNQYRIGSSTKDYLGEGLQKIIKPIQELGAEHEAAFYDYLFHQHNADRMSLERRSIEWNEEKKNTLQETVKKFVGVEKEQKALTEEKANLSRKKSDSERRGQINLRLTEIKRELVALGKQIKKLQKEINEFTALKNKPVIGLNREEIEAQKAELSARIHELGDEKKSLGFKKANEARVKEITKEIADLVKERSELTAEVTEEKSREIIDEYEKNYPEFVEVAEKIWNYNKNLNQYRVDTGMIDQAQFDYLEKLYPHYVPTYRAENKTGIAAVKGKNNLAITQTVKTATGSTKDLLNPIVIMARQTMETVRAGRINQIAKALYDGANAANDKTYISEISRDKVDRTKLVDLDPTELRPKANQVTFFKDGERITLQVASEIFAGFDAFSPQFNVQNPLIMAATAMNNAFKKLVTSANPVFLVRNTIRDLQDAGINTKYAKTFMINYARAANEIRKGGKLWELYRAMGGGNVSYFDFDKGFKAAQSKHGFEAGWIHSMENANAFVECLPRFAEFISSLEAGNSAEQAMLDAADVTTNFARTGKITKALNSTIIPFLNPAIQGASKAIRNVTSIRSVKEAAILATKAVLVGILPFALNSLLYDDDEEYQDLRETDKENNYLFKIGDKFIKIPRGRVAAVLAGAFNRTVKSFDEDEDADWLGYVKNVSTQMNPIENMARTIFSPFMDVANNVTWYGSAIEGREFENKSPAQRYDENTSSIAIALGEVLNYSPKKIHYLLDQYSGVIGDFVLPATTKKAEKDFISGNFTIDPVTSNKLSDQFYDIYYEAQYAKNANENDKTAEYQVKHLNRVKSAVSELYDEISKIQNSNKSDSEKLAETRAIRILINETYKTALNDYELITNAIEATSHVKDEYRYAEVQRLVYGAETALKTYDQKVYEKSTTLRKAGISYDNFYKYYFGIKDIKSDKDKNGNTISGSKKEKVIKKIDSLKLTDEKKLLLIVYSGYALDSEADEQKLLKYLNSLKVNTSSKQKLAEICGFDYKNGKIVFK